MLPVWLFDFSLKPKGAKGIELGLLSKRAGRRANHWRFWLQSIFRLQHGPGPTDRCLPILATSTPTWNRQCGSQSSQGFLCTKPKEPPNRNESWAQSKASGGWLTRLVSLGVREGQFFPHLSHPAPRSVAGLCPEICLPPGETDVRAHTQTLTQRTPTSPLSPSRPTPGRTGLCLNFPGWACPTRNPRLRALAGCPPEGHVLLWAPYLSHRQLLAGTGADWGGSGGGWACTRVLAHGWSSSSDTKEVACWLCPFQIQGRTYFAPEMANLCAPLPVTVPPTPAPSRLRAGPLPGGRASRPPKQWGVGKGRVGGVGREEVGKRGDPVVFGGGEESTSRGVPLRFTGKPTSQAQKATFLHLGQAQTVASNWDSRQSRGPSGILSFSFSFSFPPSLILLFLSPSPSPPPFNRGVSAESSVSQGT